MKVVIVAYSRSSLGHVARCVSAARVLVDAGHEAVVACHRSAQHLPAAQGLTWAPVREIEPAPAWTRIEDREELTRFVRGRLASPAYAATCLEDELALIDEHRPDVVLADMRNTAPVAARMSGVASCSLHNLRLFQNPMHVILPELIAALASLGVDEEHARGVLGDAMLVPDLPLFDPLSEVPPETMSLVASLVREIRHVGPLVAAGTLRTAEAPRDTLSQRRGRERLVSVLLGGGSWEDEVLGDIVAAVPEDFSLEVVQARRPGGDHAHDFGARTRVTGFRDDPLALMRASDVVVTHGGHGTLVDGLLSGTPLVCVPETTEQRRNAQRLAATGAATVVDAANVRTGLGRAVVDATAEPRRATCERLAGTARAAARSGDLVAALERTVAQA